ncbi:hypothetical protein A2331_01525 [Candidatus Falkowbacteria bacterium RIFOXYB2_FULL_34_18]|uniref:Uncharacterized protein n=1 Tax=Candidatus Falkowbacteria bacterium RIFOXYD2_FULL_34_120 TaxID=1798007 RepID=A0A1F5TQ02_9BACT|nr:MAG: hypothetical protein A2331_01525 [Candidatus Falkowbacteria bacterium RIFOXYB2_FULL_34_18]OGF29295.1 MAG: hypothetical protein A2500_05405 [Candidatus Falkowbacteria bacterium RIFOXYC12_FULL_34_55]OGF36411.1 MAG: hypothetical protein A2466_01065 [Candidatus Falkowbacteria bacterium RIFOXYC2_FULL_34_220]OGF38890.1 MAG: hypothetical protein A2515_05825 [Candidatus Falkowbacteria bacterium RIFOXYD12_FULL_34_57]OGF40909.1 MAG: hypothetical protein A2531_04050 [Candidatus Falkowbacteria bact
MATKTYKEKLNTLIFTSNLDDNKKRLWELFFKVSMPDEDEAIYEAANENEENLNLLSNHLRDRIIDLKERDADLWERLTEGEKRFVEFTN